MANSNVSIFDELSLDHVEFYVQDTAVTAAQFVDGYGFEIYGASEPAEPAEAIRSVALGKHQIRLVLTMAQGADHPAAAYVAQHGDGVANIALTTSDATEAFTEAVRRGAAAVAEPAERDGFIDLDQRLRRCGPHLRAAPCQSRRADPSGLLIGYWGGCSV